LINRLGRENAGRHDDSDGGTTQVIEEHRLLTPRASLTLPNRTTTIKWRFQLHFSWIS
jgi:hypothetical protein